MDNAKNRLLELVKDIGYFDHLVDYSTQFDHTQNLFVSSASFTLKDKRCIAGQGAARTKKEAEILASENMIAAIHHGYSDLLVDWNKIKIEAQAGDALIKLYAYLSEEMPTAEEKSMWLQKMEADQYLVKLFDQLKLKNHALVAIFGDNLGNKRKATWIEALIWREFGKSIVSKTAIKGFKGLNDFLQL